MNTQNKLSILEKISYGVGDMGCNFIWFLVAIQATFFYTEYYLSTMSVDPTVKDGFSYHLIGTFFGTEKSRWPQSLRFTLFIGPSAYIMWSMYADIADNTEVETGRRATGMIFSSATMAQKLGNTIAAIIPGAFLSWVGFNLIVYMGSLQRL